MEGDAGSQGMEAVGSSSGIWQTCSPCRGGLLVGTGGFHTPHHPQSCTSGTILLGSATLDSTRNPLNSSFIREKSRVGWEWLGCGHQ